MIKELERDSPNTTSILRLKRTSNDGSGSENAARNLQRVRIKSREETSRSKLLPKSRRGQKREVRKPLIYQDRNGIHRQMLEDRPKVGVSPSPYLRAYAADALSAEDRESTLTHFHRPRLSGRHFAKPKFYRSKDRDSTVKRERITPFGPADNP